MTQPWFSPEIAPYFSFLALLSLCALFGEGARKGRHRNVVMAVWNGVIAGGVLLLGLAGAAFLSGQPAHVLRALVVTGIVLTACFAFTRVQILRDYREAELRRTVATDL